MLALLDETLLEGTFHLLIHIGNDPLMIILIHPMSDDSTLKKKASLVQGGCLNKETVHPKLFVHLILVSQNRKMFLISTIRP